MPMQLRILVLLAASIVLCGPAPAHDVPIIGGPGGNPFKITCNDGSYLVGLAGRVGRWIDQIRPICAPWLPDKKALGAASVGIPHGDSQGGNAFDQRCPRGYAADYWFLWFTVDEDDNRKFVRAMSVGCRSMELHADIQEFQVGGPSQGQGGHIGGAPSSCGHGELAVGLHGRYGLFVDALGLVCARAPKFPGDPPAGAIAGVDQLQTAIDRPVLDPLSQVGSALGRNECLPGFVWRLAGPNDDVCVPPEAFDRTLQENASAAARRNPQGGAFGPNTCLQGFVWRGAFAGDEVCVTSEIRTVVQQENALGPSRTTGSATSLTRSK